MNFHSPHNNLTRNIDYDYIDFKYLRENSKNVNFKRGVYENHYSESKNLIDDLEKELFFDTELSYADKTIL